MAEPLASAWNVLPTLFGGVGLFLLGMSLLSGGLEAAAGSALHRALERATGSPLRAFLTGVALTAVIQSSSATTVATIGFVSSGLLSLPAAIGVIIGANVGTTSTGWLVSLLGFGLKLSSLALPLIGLGALVRVVSSGRGAHLGTALAGFGLILVAIGFLQTAMDMFAQRLDLSAFGTNSWEDRLGLTLVGTIMTVLLQSSSVAVALTLTALHQGAIGLAQAAYLVIGQNVGTALTALLAAVGATTPARRAAAAHVLFNVSTAAVTFGFASQLLSVVSGLARLVATDEPALTMALFQTTFNGLGALLFLPATQPFVTFLRRVVPERGPRLTRHLDRSLLLTPSIAVTSAARVLHDVAVVALGVAKWQLQGQRLSREQRQWLLAARTAIHQTRRFLAEIGLEDHEPGEFNRRLALLHAGDHLERLVAICLEDHGLVSADEVGAAAHRLSVALGAAENAVGEAQHLQAGDSALAGSIVEVLAQAATQHAEERRRHREWLLVETAAGRLSPDETQARLAAMRWLDRLGYHSWRALHHLVNSAAAAQSRVYGDSEPARTR